MSITNQMFRNLLQHRTCGKVHNAFIQKACSRGLHSVIVGPVKLDRKAKGIISNRIFLSDKASSGSYVNSFGRNTASFFIITRNESTTVSATTSVSNTTGIGNVDTASVAATERTSESASTSQSVQTSTPPDDVSSVISTSGESLETSQQALVFESIPEPPAIPVEEIVGMPWWASILTGTLIVRICLFPLVIKSQKNAARMQNNMPQLQILQAKMTEARQTGNALLSAKYGQDMVMFMKEKDISPFKSMLVPLAMAPVFISCFFGLRKMANLPVESMKLGGLFWFMDLTVPDPYYLLPLLTSVTVWITLEIGADGVRMNSASQGQLMKYVMRGIPVVMFPFAIGFPSAILCYWCSTNMISLIQVSLLKIPAVREKLNIEPLRKITPDMLQQKKQGFRESLKETWTNMKISNEIEQRQRYDEISFKRAGRGPIPKTFKYDPTKVDPMKEAAAAMQAKRK
ncbi:Mitochondrial inner membrane protein OXA1L [Orchesella cincta]|uniref:Mitochondrial inner membrane protein OXA1L n=1 Tax=Orchesella cincta TaxID=48709 RepID=A0A1D2NAJ7_ORCCI|nr:Mitochondrial inner membrane protein OXA1L [Orchesella cincta]